MKIQYSSVLLCLLLALANNAFAADVLVQNIHASTDCSGEATPKFIELANKCIQIGSSSGSGMYTCNPLATRIYESNDCSGDPSTTALPECDDSDETKSATFECHTFADNRLATVTRGLSCGEGGEFTGVFTPVLTIIDECIPSVTSEKSFKITVGDEDVLNISVFTASKACEGASTETTVEVGKCKSVPGVVAGVADEKAFVVVKARLEGTKLGNNAMTESVSLLVLVIAMVGAMVTMA